MNWKAIFRTEEPKGAPVDKGAMSAEDLMVQLNPHAIIDSRSQTWAFVYQWANEELQKARVKNDNPNNDIVRTAVLRGEIKILLSLISLPDPKPGRGLLLEEPEDGLKY